MKIFSATLFGISLAAITFSSCYKEEQTRFTPRIAFKTDSTYVSQDLSVLAGDSLLTGINAGRTDSADVLKTFKITKRVDAEPEVTVLTQELSGNDTLAYEASYVIKTRNLIGKETYIYKIINREGEIKEVQLNVITK